MCLSVSCVLSVCLWVFCRETKKKVWVTSPHSPCLLETTTFNSSSKKLNHHTHWRSPSLANHPIRSADKLTTHCIQNIQIYILLYSDDDDDGICPHLVFKYPIYSFSLVFCLIYHHHLKTRFLSEIENSFSSPHTSQRP